MCLLFFKPASVKFSDAQLADFWKHNRDGFGVMFAKNNVLHIDKGIGSVQDWIDFHRKYENEDACWHTRMRTHGDIDFENCHPYTVYWPEGKEQIDLPVALMHNGVLRFGNAADHTKSDTWHYIRNFIHPLTKKDPDVIFSKEFGEIIGEHIGKNNKFALMDATGRIQIVNRASGVNWNGVWFSNTYAWSARDNVLFPGINPPRVHTPTQYDWVGDYRSSPAKLTPGTLPPPRKDKLTPPVNVSPKKKGKKKATSAFEHATRPFSPESKRNGGRGNVHVPPQTGMKYTYTDFDIDYVSETLAEDFIYAMQQITVPQIETMLGSIGPSNTFEIVSRAVSNDISEEDLVAMFRDHKKAVAYLRDQAVVTR